MSSKKYLNIAQIFSDVLKDTAIVTLQDSIHTYIRVCMSYKVLGANHVYEEMTFLMAYNQFTKEFWWVNVTIPSFGEFWDRKIPL